MYTTEQSFLADFQSGEISAFKTLKEMNFRYCLAEATNILKDEQLSKDVARKVFYKCWEKRSEFHSLKEILHFLIVGIKEDSIRIKFC